jgi:hypothetical protein
MAVTFMGGGFLVKAQAEDKSMDQATHNKIASSLSTRTRKVCWTGCSGVATDE